ncbi:MAG: alanine--tRNA ligase [Candidatus Brocadiales bacterium]
MNTNDIRERFLKFFEKKGHVIVPSDSLVPTHDPTLLFTGAGMNQFKDQLLGRGKLTYTRATSSQKCLRTGDIDNVGKTTSHHTFFEMLGNFSFGDYFKKEAIEWAWEFLLKELKLPPDRLYASIYKDDGEAYEIWEKTIGIPGSKIFRYGESDNFWPANAPSQGPNGPCGPCAEIFYDQGEALGCGRKDCNPNCEHCERFVEIWNLVFVQYDRKDLGVLEPLDHRGIDTGMGLERMARVMQGVQNNFDIDIFVPIIDELKDILGTKHRGNHKAALFRRIADHMRAVVFCISDGVLPSNEGRGYVERRLLRRAVRDAMQIGLEKASLYKLVPVIAHTMEIPYPDVRERRENIARIIKNEEERFLQTYHQGMRRLEEIGAVLKKEGEKVFPPEEAFRLYDTYGFPIEGTSAYCAEEGFSFDESGFEKYMEERVRLSRVTSGISGAVFDVGAVAQLKESYTGTEFLGYRRGRAKVKAKVVAIVVDNQLVRGAEKGQSVTVVLDRTPFYGEAGGQIGDTGLLRGKGSLLEVVDTKRVDGFILHHSKVVKGAVSVGDTLTCEVDLERRSGISRSHTATHILHHVLRQVVGKHAEQAGSLVAPDRLRFDFHHFQALKRDEVSRIEDLVNEKIVANSPVGAEEMSPEEAKKRGAIALFGEKYGERVRLVNIGNYSLELCGGIHLRRTGEVGLFKIVGESSVAAGIRRLEALTGPAALKSVREKEYTVEELARMLKVQEAGLIGRVEGLLGDIKGLEREIKGLKGGGLGKATSELITRAREVSGVKIITEKVEGAKADDLRRTADTLKAQAPSIAIVLAAMQDGMVVIITSLSKDLVKRGLHAAEIAKDVAKVVGGGGGGRADMAQAGGKYTEKIDEALDYSFKLIKEKVLSGG